MSSLKAAYYNIARTQPSILLRNLTDDGLPEGNSNSNVNGSVTPVEFYVQPPANLQFEITGITIGVSDVGTPAITDYGNVLGPLTNGIQFFVDRGVTRALFGNPIHTNRELIELAPMTQRIKFAAGAEIAVYTFNAFAYSKEGIVLRGASSDKFGFIVQDNISTLVSHVMAAKGSIRLESV